MKNNQSGQVLILTIVVAGLVFLNTFFLIGGSQLFYQNTTYTIQSAQGTAIAEAGIDKAIASLNTTAGSYNGESKTSFGQGQYSVTITNKNPTTKIIKSTAFIPNEANPKVKRTVQVEVSRGIGASFNYGIQVGEGGVNMLLGSRVNGSVYSNGNIDMLWGNVITGDAYVAGGAQPEPDQQSICPIPASNCSSFIFGKRVDNKNQLDVAQSFKPAATNTLNKVAVRLKKTGSPPNINLSIAKDNSGKPDKNNIVASGTLAANLVTNNYGFVEVAFTSPPTLDANTPYWIVLDTASADSNNYWYWSVDTLSGYTRGSAKWSTNWQASNPSFTTINGSLDFKTYVGGVATYINGTWGSTIQGNAYANTLKNLTINKGAYYQTSSNITAQSYHPNSPDPGSVAMPLSDANIQSWKDLAAEGGVHTGDITNCPSTLASGKYIGSLHPPDNCTIVVDSPIWFTGDVTLGYNDVIKLKPEFGTASGAFIVDGRVTVYWLDKIQGSGTAGSYMILVSEFNTQNDSQQRDAIQVTYRDNSGILYAEHGSVRIAWGNRLTSVTAWKLRMDIWTTIDYDEGLAGAFFSSGPSGSFSLIKGTYQLK